MISIKELYENMPALHLFKGQPWKMPISYELAKFVDEKVEKGMTTVETGAGISTVCFMLKNSNHIAIAPDEGLRDRIIEYCESKKIPTGGLTYIAEKSQDCLPSLKQEFDIALIDGDHAFPIPFIDYYYLQKKIRVGGFLFVDDIEIFTGEILAKYLLNEPGWEMFHHDIKSIGFKKIAPSKDVGWNQNKFIVYSSIHAKYLQKKRHYLP